MRSPRFARDDIDLMIRSSDCLPEGEKMPTYDEIMLIKVDLNIGSADFMNNSGYMSNLGQFIRRRRI